MIRSSHRAVASLFFTLLCAVSVASQASGQPGAVKPNVPSSPAPLSASVPAATAAAATGAAPLLPAPGQTAVPASDLSRSDPSVWLGATLPQILGSFGAPQAVYSVRGPEPWQDDVVFVYDAVELYWFKDRVWQVRCNAAYGVRFGDSKENVVAALGEPLQRLESDFVYQRPSRAWPLRLRLKFGESGGVTDFYVYRADF